ncbi:MAG: type II secretion system protein [Planctomycetota bacterium]|nr:type II secretion system protein [Planctomycetota bacterium]
MARRHAFTLIELLVVLAMILLLVGIIAPALTPVLEIARRQKCAANLNKLVKDMRAYSVSNDQFFPSAFDCDATSSVKKVMGSNYVGSGRTVAAPDPSSGHSGPSRSLFLLVRGKYTSNLEAFICPSTDNTARPLDTNGKPIADPTVDYDFVSGQQLSYSYQSNKDGGNGRFWPVSMSSDATLIVLADRSPVAGTVGDDTNCWNSPAFTTWDPTKTADHGGWDKYTKNSYNHGVNSAGDGGEGQNVADAAGGVAWKDTPNCGGRVWKDGNTPKGDNIWTWGSADAGVPQSGGDVDASPAHAGDSFLR